MPRLTDHDYLRNYEFLRSHRTRGDRVFSLVKVSEQQALFSYYPFHERRARAELLEHRRLISRIYPSLPHQAGRALKRLGFLREQPRTPLVAVKRRGRGQPKSSDRFELAFEVRPEPDVQQLALAFIELAKYLNENDGTGRSN